MKERAIVVPEGMLKASSGAAHEYLGYCTEGQEIPVTRAVIEAALRWLSENPIVPTEGQARDLQFSSPADVHYGRWMAVEWQRRMFLAPVDETPEELKKMFFGEKRTDIWADEANHMLRMAFKRGQRSQK